jgi:hypothetical protein
MAIQGEEAPENSCINDEGKVLRRTMNSKIIIHRIISNVNELLLEQYHITSINININHWNIVNIGSLVIIKKDYSISNYDVSYSMPMFDRRKGKTCLFHRMVN